MERRAPIQRLWHGDCRAGLKKLPANSIDSVVTDPPYELAFMGRKWDGTGIAFSSDFWAEVMRVLKPGGHIAAFGASRGYHRMACAIEDAGFEIRDSLMWIYGQGFPKSHDVSKGIDRAAGAERELTRAGAVQRSGYGDDWDTGSSTTRPRFDRPATADAREWQGWGTALKPAFEPIVLARKPLSEGTVAANVLKWGTGALNIDGTRIPSGPDHAAKCASVLGLDSNRNGDCYGEWKGARTDSHSPLGRWPANVCHDGSDEVVGMFPTTSSGGYPPEGGQRTQVATYGKPNVRGEARFGGSAGSAARFFYSAKANAKDRAGSKHPTVKPIALMQWLARLITPPGGVILDPFAGSGTTGAAAVAEGCSVILCEREDEYIADIKRRMGEAA